MNKTKMYIPTEAEKLMLNAVCNKVIDFMSDLSIEQKAFALNNLIDAYEDVANIRIIVIK